MIGMGDSACRGRRCPEPTGPGNAEPVGCGDVTPGHLRSWLRPGLLFVVLVASVFGRGDQFAVAATIYASPVRSRVPNQCPTTAPVVGPTAQPPTAASRTTIAASSATSTQVQAGVSSGVSTGETDRRIRDAELRIARNSGDASAKKLLVAALLQKVREEADPSLYVRIDSTLAALGGATSQDPEVLLLEGTLLLARHQFSEALAVGRRASAALPGNPGAYGILVDAYNELGRYDDALRVTQQMIDAHPGLASFARVSYARELRGDTAGALQAMQQAVIASQGRGENGAYVETLLGNLFLSQGNTKAAATSYADALDSFPGFGPALAGQAAILMACARPLDAALVLGRVIDTQPVLQYSMAQATYYDAAGRAREAGQARELVDAIAALQRANGVDVDLEMAVYDADYRPSASLLARTRKAAAKRPSVAGHDALAWALYRSGQYGEAAREIAHVVSLGDRDPVFRFHAAMIAMANGQRAMASTNLAVVVGGNSLTVGIDQRELAQLRSQLRM